MIDLLLTGGTVVTVDADRRVLLDGAVAIDGGRIVATVTGGAGRAWSSAEGTKP